MNWLFVALGAIPTLVISIFLHNWDVNRLQKINDDKLAAQVQFDIKQCADEKQITSNVGTDYENKINDLNDQLNKLRQQAPRIIYVTKPATGANAAGAKGINAEGNGIDSSRFIEYGGKCEKLRLTVSGLQDFINQTWKLKGQN